MEITKKAINRFSTIYRPFGALEGTRIPGPLIKSQMLYRLSYERIFCNNTILPNNITINADKMQVPGRKFLRCTYEVPRGDFK